MSVAARLDGDHFELPADAAELLRQVRPADQQWFIEEVTQALAVAADTKDFGPLLAPADPPVPGPSRRGRLGPGSVFHSPGASALCEIVWLVRYRVV
jgi:hypothetical protein